jgi:hypothetical protein
MRRAEPIHRTASGEGPKVMPGNAFGGSPGIGVSADVGVSGRATGDWERFVAPRAVEFRWNCTPRRNNGDSRGGDHFPVD